MTTGTDLSRNRSAMAYPLFCQRRHDADGRQVGPVIKVDFLDVLVLDDDFHIIGSQGRKGGQAQVGKPEDEVPPEASLRPAGADDFNFHFLSGHG